MKERERLPHLTVAALIANQGRYLMIKERQDGQIVLNQPAGHVENAETLQQAVIREALEESGWQVEPISILGIYGFTPNASSDTYHRVCFICRPIEQISTQLDPDIIGAEWLTRSEIEALPRRSPLIMACINDYEAAQSYPLDMINNAHIEAN